MLGTLIGTVSFQPDVGDTGIVLVIDELLGTSVGVCLGGHPPQRFERTGIHVVASGYAIVRHIETAALRCLLACPDRVGQAVMQ